MERNNDGQHRSGSYYSPGNSSGQKSTITSGRVGMKSGGETHDQVGTVHRSVNVNTTTGSAGPRAEGEVTSADDK